MRYLILGPCHFVGEKPMFYRLMAGGIGRHDSASQHNFWLILVVLREMVEIGDDLWKI